MLKLMYNGNTVTCGGGFVSFPDPAHFVTLIQNTSGTIAADKVTFTGNSPTNYFKDVNTGTTWTATGYVP